MCPIHTKNILDIFSYTSWCSWTINVHVCMYIQIKIYLFTWHVCVSSGPCVHALIGTNLEDLFNAYANFHVKSRDPLNKNFYPCVCLAKTGRGQWDINSTNMFPKISFSEKMPPSIPKNYLRQQISIFQRHEPFLVETITQACWSNHRLSGKVWKICIQESLDKRSLFWFLNNY